MVNVASKITELTLVAGGSYAEREAWIATTLQNISSHTSQQKIGVLLEGLPSGTMSLQSSSFLQIERIAPGCFCCIGQIAMRVSLNRLLRQQLGHLFVAINDEQHLSSFHASLNQAPYSEIIKCRDIVSL